MHASIQHSGAKHQLVIDSDDAQLHMHAQDGFSPLYFAALKGQLGVVRALLASGADVNQTAEVWGCRMSDAVLATSRSEPVVYATSIKAGKLNTPEVVGALLAGKSCQPSNLER